MRGSPASTPLGWARDCCPAESQLLVDAVDSLRGAVAETSAPCRSPAETRPRENRIALLRQLDDYVLPRLRALDAPLLAVVGGSTGAKVDPRELFLVGAQVSRTGVIRPTTTRPVLVHHPDDAHWFADDRILPGLARVTGAETAEGAARHRATGPLDRPAPPGMALLDAPDIDSVVQANRELAGQLLAAADLWLFVTTAARYADAVPWDLLRTASERGTAVAIISTACHPRRSRRFARTWCRCCAAGLSTAPVFSIPESTLTTQGHLPQEAMAPSRHGSTPRVRHPCAIHRRQPDAAGRYCLAG